MEKNPWRIGASERLIHSHLTRCRLFTPLHYLPCFQCALFKCVEKKFRKSVGFCKKRKKMPLKVYTCASFSSFFLRCFFVFNTALGHATLCRCKTMWPRTQPQNYTRIFQLTVVLLISRPLFFLSFLIFFGSIKFYSDVVGSCWKTLVTFNLHPPPTNRQDITRVRSIEITTRTRNFYLFLFLFS